MNGHEYRRSSGGSGLRSCDEAIWGELTSGRLCARVSWVAIDRETTENGGGDVLDGRRGRIRGC